MATPGNKWPFAEHAEHRHFLRHLSELICEFRVDSKQVSVRASLTWSRSSICRIQVECIIRLAVHADGDAWFKCTFRHHPDHVSRNVWIDQSMPDLFAFLKAMPISVLHMHPAEALPQGLAACYKPKPAMREWTSIRNAGTVLCDLKLAGSSLSLLDRWSCRKHSGD